MPDKKIVEDYPDIPEKYAKYLKCPYGGLFGNTVHARIIERIVANPSRVYRPKDFREMLGISTTSITKALNDLVGLKILKKVSRDKQRPEYMANMESKQLYALTFLAYAVGDDRDGTEFMDHAIEDYRKACGRPGGEAVKVAGQEVFIDLPGMSDTGTRDKAVFNGIGIYMPFSAARKLAKALRDVFESSEKA